jgi:ADP-ribose pyrophosphatase YjhB (NUDIX family)
VIAAVGGIIFDGARVLLVQRSRDPGRGLWTVPGGKVEPGETHAAAVAREVAEETGLVVTVGPLVARVAVGPYEIHDYLAEVISGTLAAGSDAADARFCDADELARLPLTEGLLDVLAQARRVTPRG